MKTRFFNCTLYLVLSLVLFACDSAQDDDDSFFSEDETETEENIPVEVNACELPQDQIVSGGPGKDGIPALTNPLTESPQNTYYLSDSDRVIGLILDGRPLAVPHNILWWHEIANFDGQQQFIAATYCPLTGSSIVFDRRNAGNAELGVSGLLYQNNLIMYDRNEEEALWSQMLTGASCNSEKEITLETFAHVEMTWGGWKALYPDTEVISTETGYFRNYFLYPYGDYEEENNTNLLFSQKPLDTRRPPKERALGLPDMDGRTLVYPFGVLDADGPKNIVNDVYKGKQIVVLWDREKQSAAAFEPITMDGAAVELVVQDDKFVDAGSGAVFEVNGVVFEGTMAGATLRPVPEAYAAFWFAWAAFHPDVDLYGPAS